MECDSRWKERETTQQKDMFEETEFEPKNPDWQEHWKDMPEYIQKEQEPYQMIIIRFSCEADVKEFSNLVKQNITKNTKDMWYPKLLPYKTKDWGYKSES